MRFNSADSGPGSIKIARLTETDFDSLFEVPAGVEFIEDELTWEVQTVVNQDTDEEEETCVLARESFGFPWAAINELNTDNEPALSWYAYGGVGGLSAPENVVYLLQDEEGLTFK